MPVVVLTALDLTREDRFSLHEACQTLHKGGFSMRMLAECLHHLGAKARAESKVDNV